MTTAQGKKPDNFSGLYQSLAATDVRKRSRAFSKLQTWLRGNLKLDETACLKLWKALFYCMYMCDKTEPQQQLAEDLSRLALHFRPAEEGKKPNTYDSASFSRAFAFVRVFFTTIVREFPGIDQHRKDKYLSLIRKMVHGSLLLLKQNGWHRSAVETFTGLLEELFHVNGKKIGGVHRVTADVRLQVADVFLRELQRATTDVGDNLPGDTLLALIEPFLVVASAGAHRPTITRVVDNVLNELVDGIDSFPLANISKLQSTIFDVATAATTRENNRKIVFALHKRLKRNVRGLPLGRKGRLMLDGDGEDCEAASSSEPANSAEKSEEQSSMSEKLALTAAFAEAPTPKSGMRHTIKPKKRKKADSGPTLVVEGAEDDDADLLETEPQLRAPSRKMLRRAQRAQEREEQMAREEEEAAENAAALRRGAANADENAKHVRFALAQNKVRHWDWKVDAVILTRLCCDNILVWL